MNLNFPFPPGDCWCLTRYLRDFHEQYPGEKLAPVVPRPEMFLRAPYYHAPVAGDDQIRFRFEPPGARPTYGNRSKADTMVKAIYDGINRAGGFEVEMRTMAPEFYPTDTEKRYSLVPHDRPVCVMNAGWKSDIPVKFWGTDKFQQVVNALHGRVDFVQVGASRRGTDFHKPLEHVINLTGRTTLRELAQLVYHADFVLTGISQLHHLAGIQCYKPRHCITIAGAREPENWANCHRRAGVSWTWIKANDRFRGCMEQNPDFHDCPGCWRHDCNSGKPPRCMDSIEPDEVISIFEERLK